MPAKKAVWIWVDLEMTGLNVSTNLILEIATLVTDDRLNIIAEGPDLVIHQPTEILDNMDEWNTSQHTKSGLIEEVKKSTLTVSEAEEKTLEFLSKYVKSGASPMCGNSICLDRRFMHRYMPTLESFFHYRNLDVSTFKELVKRWFPGEHYQMSKNSSHRAMDDIKDSVKELAYYYKNFIKLNNP